MPDSVTIKRDVILRAIVTEGLKEELDDEFEEAIGQLDQRITQLDIGARQYVTELQRNDIQQAMAVRQQIEAEKRRLRQAKDGLIQRQRAVQELELGSEIIRGTLEGQTEVQVGDNLQTALRGVEVVVKDDEIVEIRETEGGVSLEAEREVTPEVATEVETPSIERP
ncbi:MAG: YlqD family protein [Armatimonadota bacterium]|nr:YlqD family protein [Armatimonadota bacterium]